MKGFAHINQKISKFFNPRLTEPLFVTQLTKGGGVDTRSYFQNEPPYDVYFGIMVSLESHLNIDTQNQQHAQLASVTS